MENLHLKNLKNIYSPKYIEDRLNNIETPHYVLNNFKETFISDLYNIAIDIDHSNKIRSIYQVNI